MENTIVVPFEMLGPTVNQLMDQKIKFTAEVFDFGNLVRFTVFSTKDTW